jgi:TonB family protein
MKTLLVLVTICLVTTVSAQVINTHDSTKYSDPQNMDVIYSGEARYIGTETEMYAIIYKSIVYSQEAKDANIDSEVLVSFDVNFDGKLQDFVIITNAGHGIDEQIVVAIKAMEFVPAVMNGIQVRQNVMLTIPIRTYPDM